jgi:hypothetical protein
VSVVATSCLPGADPPMEKLVQPFEVGEPVHVAGLGHAAHLDARIDVVDIVSNGDGIIRLSSAPSLPSRTDE